MRLRFIAPITFAIAAFAAAGLARAADTGIPKAAESPAHKAEPADPAKPHDLDFLFGALKAAPDDQSAHAIEQRIWTLWGKSPSDTATLLMSRVQKAIEAKETDLAIELLDAVVKIKPDYVEGWNRRATLYYMQKDYGRALADIREVLKREPRHFGALSGMGLILQDIGDDKQALEVYRRTLTIYPRIQRIPDLVKELSEKVEGKEI
jgi:tetratricopeptide (TPR) repeat protein